MNSCAPYKATVILLRMMSFHWQRPYPPSCDFHRNPSQKLRITVFKPASWAITCSAHVWYQIWQCHFVCNVHVLLHTNFHCNPSLPQHHFVGNVHVLFHADFCPNPIILATRLRVRAFRAQLHTRSKNQQRRFFSNAHVLLHADFSPNPIILAAINC